MNPDKPKFLAAVVRGSAVYLIGPSRIDDVELVGFDRAIHLLAERGQVATWPVGPGVAVIKDIPKPEPLPTTHYWRSDVTGKVVLSPSDIRVVGYTLVATVTFDEDDNATVTRVAS